MDDKINALLKEMAQAASYFGRKATEIGLDPDEINGLVFSSNDGYINCHIEHYGVRYEACRGPRSENVRFKKIVAKTEKLEEVEDDLPFC